MILDETSNYRQAKTLLVAVCSSNQTRRQELSTLQVN